MLAPFLGQRRKGSEWGGLGTGMGWEAVSSFLPPSTPPTHMGIFLHCPGPPPHGPSPCWVQSPAVGILSLPH